MADFFGNSGGVIRPQRTSEQEAEDRSLEMISEEITLDDPAPDPFSSSNDFFADAGGPALMGRVRPQARGITPFIGEGIAEGLNYPFQLFSKNEREPRFEAITAGQKVAKGAGFLVGGLLGYAPYGIGTTALFRGVGLTARLGSNLARGQSVYATAGYRGAHGVVSGAAFEAGASEDVGEIPQRALIGAALGGGSEIALLGIARAWRGKFPREVKNPDSNVTNAPLTPEDRSAIVLHPDAAVVERQIRAVSQEHADNFLITLRDINVEDQLDVVGGVVASTLKPHGAMVMRGVTDVDEVVNFARRHSPNLQSVSRKTEDGLNELLLVDPEAAPFFVKSNPRVRQVMEKRTTSLDDWEEVIRLIEEPIPGEPAPMVGVFTDFSNQQKKSFLDLLRQENLSNISMSELRKLRLELNFLQAEGMHTYLSNIIAVLPTAMRRRADLAPRIWNQMTISTLVHEFTHAITAQRAFNLAKRSGMTPDEIKALRRRPESLAESLPRTQSRLSDQDFIDLETKLRVATEELLADTYRVLGFTDPENSAISTISGNLDYFHHPEELMARGVELLLRKPQAFKQIMGERFAREFTDELFERSQKLRWMIEGTREENITRNVMDLLHHRWINEVGLGTESADFFVPSNFRLSGRDINQFRAGDLPGGIGVTVDGKEFLWSRRLNGDVLLFDPRTGQRVTVPRDGIEVPTFGSLFKRQQQVVEAIDGVLNRGMNWLGVAYRLPAGGGVQRASVDITDFQKFSSWGEVMRRYAPEVFPPGPGRFNFEARNNFDSARSRVLSHLRNQEIPGIVVEQGGVPEVYAIDVGRIDRGVRVGGPEAGGGWGDRIDAVERFRLSEATDDFIYRIEPSYDNVARSLLMNAGVTEREMPHFMNILKERTTRRLMDLVDEDVLNTWNSAQRVMSRNLPDRMENTGSLASRTDTRIERLGDGDWGVSSRDDILLSRVPSEDDARRTAQRMGTMPADAIDGNSSIPTEGLGGSIPNDPPAPPNGTLTGEGPRKGWTAAIGTGFTNLYDAANVAVGRWFTNMDNFMQSAERLGIGPLYQKVYLPLQEGARKIGLELNKVKRDGLNGLTIDGQLKKIEKMLGGVQNDRMHLMSEWMQALSKEEVASAGGLLQRGMSRQELAASQAFESLGLADDIPRLLTLNRLISGYLKNKKDFVNNKLPRMEQTWGVRDDLVPIVERMKQQALTAENRTQLMAELGISDAERWGLGALNDLARQPKDQVSIFAIYRHSTAKPLGEGFENGRAMFAAEHGMTGRETAVAREMEKLLDVGFEMSGLDAKRYLGGYWPHVKKMAERGMLPDDPWLKRDLPEAAEFFAKRFRTGEVDIYATDPMQVMVKYLRSLLNEQYITPHLDEARRVIDGVRESAPRVGRVAEEYLGEILGRPHESFKMLDGIIAEPLKQLGYDVPDRLAERIINQFTALGYAAAIPLRPALVVRNWFQYLQQVPPRVGVGDSVEGFSKALTREGFEEAWNAGAILPNVAPVHAAETLGRGGPRLSDKMGSAFRNLDRRWRDVADVGFNWYRKADEVGRAGAYHAQVGRLRKNFAKYKKGQQTYMEFLENSKVMTYSSNDREIFERMLRAGEIEEAFSHLGVRLADQTHFRYGYANHPAGWGGVAGRLFGQFGTYSVQYKDFLMEGLMRGTAKDRMEFAMLHTAMNTAIIGTGGAMGLNLGNWMTFSSVFYTGGPYVDAVANMYQAYSGRPEERALAMRNLEFMFPTMSDPRSFALPFSFMIGDVFQSFDQDDWLDMSLSASGFRLLEPTERTWVQNAFESF